MHFSKTCVEKILKNIFYTGKFLWRNKEYQGTHEVIIPKEHLRAVFNREKGGFSRRPKGSLSSFLRCANPECQCQIIYDPKKKVNKTTGETRDFPYYHCSDGKRIHRDAGEKQININEDKIFDQFGIAIGDISITEDLASAISAALRKTHEKAVVAHKRTMESYKHAIKKTEADEDGAYHDLKSRLIEEDFYHRQIQKIRNERRHFEGLLEQSQLIITGAFYETAEKILELAKMAESLWKSRSSQEKVEMLKMVLSNPALDGLNVRYDLNPPFKVLSLMKGNENWCPLVDDYRTAVMESLAQGVDFTLS